MSSKKEISKILKRGITQILPDEEDLIKLMKRRKIRLYFGCDPTSPQLHLGHAAALRKLSQFQELGHKVILVFGTFTAQIGDPSGRSKKREALSEAKVKENMSTYKDQASKILDMSQTEIKKNDEWLSDLNFKKVIELTSNFTVSQLLERDMFQERISKEKEVWMSELLYPIMQGYDSVALDVDLELGGTDQTFNMLMGRKLQKIYNDKEKFVLTVPILLGLDGRKMSKSYGNTVNLTDSADEMYGKIMSIEDSLIPQYFELCTDVPLKKVGDVKKKLEQQKINPKKLKVDLAKEITSIYHGEEKANEAAKEFKKIFKEKKMPSDIPEVSIKKTLEIKPGEKINILDLIEKTGLSSSKSEARRLIEQNGIKIDKKTQKDWEKIIKAREGMIIQRGKRKFIRLVE